MSREIKYFPIHGHEGYYVDVKGNVYSRWVNKGLHGLVLENNYKKLKPKVNAKSGHHSISLGRKHQKLIHRLAYEAIIGPIPEGLVVRHLNDIPSDNRIENLALGTQSDNMLDCVRNGHHGSGTKITFKDCEKIWKLKETLSWKAIAEIYGACPSTIRKHANKYKEIRRNKLELYKSNRKAN